MAVSNAIVAGALLIAASIAGCASPPAALGTHTAKVRIDGHDTGQPHRISCSQFGWYWKIETLDKSPGFTATMKTGDTVTAEQVYIRDLGGFTGTYGRDIVGHDDARVNAGTFQISGKALGFYSHDPSETASASFTITTDC